MTKHSYFPYTSTYTSRVTMLTENTTSITSLTQPTSYFNTPRLKNALSLTTAATQQTFHRSPHSHYNRYKTNMRHIHTSNFFMHITSRGNNKLLRTPPPHISRSEEILPGLTRRIIAQLRTNKSASLKSYLHKLHPSPLCPLKHSHTQHTSYLQLRPHTHQIVTPEFVDRNRRCECTAGQMDGEAGWRTTSGKIGLPPTTIVSCVLMVVDLSLLCFISISDRVTSDGPINLKGWCCLSVSFSYNILFCGRMFQYSLSFYSSHM